MAGIIPTSKVAHQITNKDINQEQEAALHSFAEKIGDQIGATAANLIVGIMTLILANRQQLSASNLEPPISKQQPSDTVPISDILMTAREVGATLKISKSKAYQMIQQGEISAVHMGKSIRVRKKDLEEFITNNLERAK